MNEIEIEIELNKLQNARRTASSRFGKLYDDLQKMDSASETEYMQKQAEMLVYELSMNAADAKIAHLMARKFALLGDVQGDA